MGGGGRGKVNSFWEKTKDLIKERAISFNILQRKKGGREKVATQKRVKGRCSAFKRGR